jgi:hypothetical protein
VAIGVADNWHVLSYAPMRAKVFLDKDRKVKIVFLDIDGVLNSVRYDRARTDGQGNNCK